MEEGGRKTVAVGETALGSEEARKDFSSIMDRAWEGERFIVSRFDRDRIVILGLKDFERLKALEQAAAAAVGGL